MKRLFRFVIALSVIAAGTIAFQTYDSRRERNVAAVEPGRIFRGAWQRPAALGAFLRREHVRTIVTLTAINRDDPKYVSQEDVVQRADVDWIIIPMRGSTATLDQLAQAADVIADTRRQPVFFHCVGGHHRSNLVHAAYRIRHQGWTADDAWRELCALPWTRPERDQDDRSLIEAFAASPLHRSINSAVAGVPMGNVR